MKNSNAFLRTIKWSILLFLLFSIVFTLSYGKSQAHEKMPSGKISIVVKKGDSLWTIARRIAPNHNTNEVVWYLLHLNGKENKIVKAGEVLTFDYTALD